MRRGETAGRAGSAPGALDRLSERWDASPLLQLVAPVFCVAWEAMMFSRLAFLEPETLSRGPLGALAPGGMWIVLGVMTAACLALFVRHRFPVGVVLAEGALAIVAALLGTASSVYFLSYVAAYACAARAPSPRAAAGAAAGAALLAAMYAIDAVADPPSAAAPWGAAVSGMLLYALVIACALSSHLRFDRRRTAREAEARDRARAAELARVAAARDAAEARGRIAAELHDSVGHDLTAIIALAEGLDGATGDDEMDGAVARIGRLARDGLADTRRAVRALAAGGAGNPAARAGALHAWDEIRTVLDDARALGIAATLTETGRRTADARQADLVFSVSREAVTNAIRHGRGVRRISASWDHAADGSCAVTVRDDGAAAAGEGASDADSPRGTPDATGAASARGRAGDAGSGSSAAPEAADTGPRSRGTSDPAAPAPAGTGLVRLRGRVEVAGGSLQAGPEAGGWVVRAVVPRFPEEG